MAENVLSRSKDISAVNTVDHFQASTLIGQALQVNNLASIMLLRFKKISGLAVSQDSLQTQDGSQSLVCIFQDQ